jgi:hypothetical protein
MDIDSARHVYDLELIAVAAHHSDHRPARLR